jgi:hypothetical protein
MGDRSRPHGLEHPGYSAFLHVEVPNGGTYRSGDCGTFVTVALVFDVAFFGRAFAERIQEFSRDHDDASVRLEIVTLTGERLDALEIRVLETGTRVYTRDDRLVFLPYQHIGYIDVSILQDHRIPGFRISTGSESG